jgi:hypothetical protein
MKEPSSADIAARAHAKMSMAAALAKASRESALDEIFKKPQREAINKWIAEHQDPALDEIEAVRRLVEIGLRAKGK